MNTKLKTEKRNRRKKRIKAKIFGVAERPRLSVFRSNKYISAQLIDDEKGVSLAFASSKNIKSKSVLDKAGEVGAEIAKQAKTKKITKVVFDREGYLYTGRIAALAQGARKAGLEF
ncbi:MAG: 50S ribosomal protein L18 [Candidatus Zambryskibacteria bacterium]|nr:50S ribosomal protein L18 [Candidatus Zambryskibacteria bacterium]